MARKILVISASAGNGHVRAAQAIEAAGLESNEALEIRHVDLYQYTFGLNRWACSRGFILMIEHFPFAWKMLYKVSDCQKKSLFARLQDNWERFAFRGILKEIQEFQPDDIVCTHFTPPRLILNWKKTGKVNARLWIQVTDFHLHLQWLYDGVDGYFVGNRHVKEALISHGVDAEKIVVNGIPIMPIFSKELSREVCAAELGIDPNKTTYLLMNGGSANRSNLELAEKILKISTCQLIFVAGRSEWIYEKLCEMKQTYPLLCPIGFSKTIDRIMTCSDIFISKPGGLSTSEAMAKKLPMIAFAPIPGHEEENAKMLAAHGAAIRADTADELFAIIEKLESNPNLLLEMKQNIGELSQPFAAQRVIEEILKKS